MLLLVMFLTISAWAPGNTAKAAPASKYFPYYFYNYPSYDFLGLESITDAEIQMMDYYGYVVDQNSGSGTLVAVGYSTPVIYGQPSVKLYAHLPLQP